MNRELIDVAINPSSIGAIPAGLGETVIWDSTLVKPGQFNPEPDPATGLYVASGTYLRSCLHIKSILLALNATGQNVTFKLYWWIGAAFVLVNGSGKVVTAGTPLTEVITLGGDGTKLTYVAGATPPTTMVISGRLRNDLAQPTITTI